MPLELTGITGNMDSVAIPFEEYVVSQVETKISQERAHKLIIALSNPLGDGSVVEGFLHLVVREDPKQTIAFKMTHSHQKSGQEKSFEVTGSVLRLLFEKDGLPTDALEEYLKSASTDKKIAREQIQRIILDGYVKTQRLSITTPTLGGAECVSKQCTFGAFPLLEAFQSDDKIPESTARASLYNVKMLKDGRSMVCKMFHRGSPVEVTLDAHGRLRRSKEVTAAYLKKSVHRGIIMPSYFLVKIEANEKPIEQLVVPGGESFREWAKWNLSVAPGKTPPKIEIIGILMEKAKGEEVASLASENRLTRKSVDKIATGLLAILKENALGGFVHGDIKLENIFFDAHSGKVQLIDTSGLVKISRRMDRMEATCFSYSKDHTPAYSHPLIPMGAFCGVEQDLFSVGITILLLNFYAGNARDSVQASSLRQALLQSYEDILNDNSRKSYHRVAKKVLKLIDSYCSPSLSSGWRSHSRRSGYQSVDRSLYLGGEDILLRNNRENNLEEIKEIEAFF